MTEIVKDDRRPWIVKHDNCSVFKNSFQILHCLKGDSALQNLSINGH